MLIRRVGQRHIVIPDFGVRVRAPRSAAVVAGNGLLNNLMFYRPGNELSGDLLDLHTYNLLMQPSHNPTSGPGLVYAKARLYASIPQQYHWCGDSPYLSTGDVDFTVAMWVNMTALPAIWAVFMHKGWVANNPNLSEFAVGYIHSTVKQFNIYFGDNVHALGILQGSTFGAAVAGQWYLVVAWHDAVANKIYLQVNNTTPDSMAWNYGLWDSNYGMTIGAAANGSWYTDGLIGPSMMWKSAPGGGGALDDVERDLLWNGGAGLPFASFTW
jgi:hypothetical protein